jgi:methyl-accepting chemotaxis protein
MERSAEQLLLESAALDKYFTTGEDRYATSAEAAKAAHSEEWAIVKEYGLAEGLEGVEDVEYKAYMYDTVLQRALEAYAANPDEIGPALMELDVAADQYSIVYTPARGQLSTELRARVLAYQEYVGRLLTATTAAAVGMGALALVIAAASAYSIGRGITRAAGQLAAAAESISRGELDVLIDVRTGDEMQDLAESIERMRTSLKAAIERLRRRPATT